MSITIYFLWRNKKKYADIPAYLEVFRITRKPHLRLAKAGVVLFSSGLNRNFTVQ